MERLERSARAIEGRTMSDEPRQFGTQDRPQTSVSVRPDSCRDYMPMVSSILRVSWLGVALVLSQVASRRMSVFAIYTTVEIYSDANCESTPLVVTLERMNTTCTPSGTCHAIEISNSSYYYAQRCATNRFKYTSELFRGAKYLMIDGFQDANCGSYARSNVFLAAGTCQLASYIGQRSEIATLFNDGSAYMTIYKDSACAKKAQVLNLNTSIIQTHECYKGYNKFYTSEYTGISTNQGSAFNDSANPTTLSLQDTAMSPSAVLGIILMCSAIIVLPIWLLYWKLRRSKQRAQKPIDRLRRRTLPEMSLAMSGKHEHEQEYAPEVSPPIDRNSALSGLSGQNDVPSPLQWSKKEQHENLRHFLHEKAPQVQECGFQSTRGLKREDLSERQQAVIEPQSNELNAMALSPVDANNSMPTLEFSINNEPIHAQKLRGPVTADSVCEDDAILSSRIPRDHVLVDELIGRGGYGEVYKGTYETRAVAIKMLFPETRKSTRHVTEFLTEVKMMTALNHPCVVEFIGVSWTHLMDLCVVTEYMEGGDLRAWLSARVDQKCPVGFDRWKIQIATHVAHALTYLHGLTPSVIHRDLKSRNILLHDNLNAKLADFGASRERTDQTMTAGVGTSLWIAPEVMMGERYDDKADVFSFGVVLSELDSHETPYAHVKDKSPMGRKMPETAILQLVAMGKLRVEFSPKALQTMVQLGTACTAIDPTERPLAVEALEQLKWILAKEMKKRP